MREILTFIGLILNLLGTIFIARPILQSKAWIKDDFIVKSGRNNKGEYYYERRGFKKIKYWALIGILFLGVGFVLQLVALWLK